MKIPAMMSLLLVSVGLRDGVQVQSYSISQLDIFSQETPLDMAPASFDDQYAGCLADMTAALPDLNHSEFQANKVYADGWTLANIQWQERRTWGSVWGSLPPPPPGFRDEHGVALLAYTANSPLHKEFNAAVREAGRSRAHYLHHFSFKTLHFLLTEALQLLRSHRSRGCRQVINTSRPAQGPARIYLRALGKSSTYNCEYIKEKKCRSGPCWLDSSAPGSLSVSWSLLLLLWFLLLRALPENPGPQ
ncbi:GPI-linked NAD(P)(+)--arginine ADP-ribosyltransferase 1 isoform X5 [Arvicanthis niloticus]|uniref:GPI-linked NAD(P)(+)--arginine ADP-ribosyltransferase 1 isoform X5 n=1 Tax=Arvicanthis niloticus TaxID=61156 RepID=UPI00148685EB|nr:GPI-linked NAD(P)(+)--arginine ADP-ribosyltransferase 1 isoform X4 [Arvicanthis niloticus]